MVIIEVWIVGDDGDRPATGGSPSAPTRGNNGQFLPGHVPHNHLPVGTEILRVDGYVWVKIAEPNKWRQKHYLLWESAHGQVPPGHVLIFGDGDRQNISLDNLILITKAKHATMNKLKLRQNDIELTRTGLLIAEVHSAAYARGKKHPPPAGGTLFAKEGGD